MTIRPLTEAEARFTYTESANIQSYTGCIGHLRADFGSAGTAFYSSWEDHILANKSAAFMEEIDHVVNTLRGFEGSGFETFLKDRASFRKYFASLPMLECEKSLRFVGAFTDAHAYLMRLDNREGVYDLYCYCYKREVLENHINAAKAGIRFIDPNYEERFRLHDGDSIRIITPDGTTVDRSVSYIDDYHFELGPSFSPNVFHICEFAEGVERNGTVIIPLRKSLPPMAYVHIKSTDEIGIVDKGINGYRKYRGNPDDADAKIPAEDMVEALNKKLGVTKRQAEAMLVGSMFGWHAKGANPDNYNDDGTMLDPSMWR